MIDRHERYSICPSWMNLWRIWWSYINGILSLDTRMTIQREKLVYWFIHLLVDRFMYFLNFLKIWTKMYILSNMNSFIVKKSTMRSRGKQESIFSKHPLLHPPSNMLNMGNNTFVWINHLFHVSEHITWNKELHYSFNFFCILTLLVL